MAPVDAQELQMAVQGVLLWNARYGLGLWRTPVSVAGGGACWGALRPLASLISPAESVSLQLGLVVVGCGAAVGVCARLAAVAAAMRGLASPHLPQYATCGPGPLYLRMLAYELVLTAALATCRNFPVCHVVTTLAFGDAMAR